MARHGEVRLGAAWLGLMTSADSVACGAFRWRHHSAGRGRAGPGKAWRGLAGLGVTGRGPAWADNSLKHLLWMFGDAVSIIRLGEAERDAAVRGLAGPGAAGRG